MRNALAHMPKGQPTVVAAAIRQRFNQPDQNCAVEVWRPVAGQLGPDQPASKHNPTCRRTDDPKWPSILSRNLHQLDGRYLRGTYTS